MATPDSLYDPGTYDPEALQIEQGRLALALRMRMAAEQQAQGNVFAPLGGQMIGAGKYQHYVPDVGGGIGRVANALVSKGREKEAADALKEHMRKAGISSDEFFNMMRASQPKPQMPLRTSPIPIPAPVPQGPPPTGPFSAPAGAPGMQTTGLQMLPQTGQSMGLGLQPPKASGTGMVQTSFPDQGSSPDAMTQGYNPDQLPEGEDLGSDPNYQPPNPDEEIGGEYLSGMDEAEGEGGETLAGIDEAEGADDGDEPDQSGGAPPDEGEPDEPTSVAGDPTTDSTSLGTAVIPQEANLGLKAGTGFIRDPKQEAQQYNQQYQWGPNVPEIPPNAESDEPTVVPGATMPAPAPEPSALPQTRSAMQPVSDTGDREMWLLQGMRKFPQLRQALAHAYGLEAAAQAKNRYPSNRAPMNLGHGVYLDPNTGEVHRPEQYTQAEQFSADKKMELAKFKSGMAMESTLATLRDKATTREERDKWENLRAQVSRERMRSQEKIAQLNKEGRIGGKQGQLAGIDQPINQQQLTQGMKSLSHDMKDMAPLKRDLSNLKGIIESYPKGASIPGMGIAHDQSSHLPGDAARNNAAIYAVTNTWLRKNSGLAVTESEEGRMIKQMASGGTYTQEQFLRVLPLLFSNYNDTLANVRGGYHPKVIEAWQKNSDLSMDSLDYPEQTAEGKPFNLPKVRRGQQGKDSGSTTFDAQGNMVQ